MTTLERLSPVAEDPIASARLAAGPTLGPRLDAEAAAESYDPEAAEWVVSATPRGGRPVEMRLARLSLGVFVRAAWLARCEDADDCRAYYRVGGRHYHTLAGALAAAKRRADA